MLTSSTAPIELEGVRIEVLGPVGPASRQAIVNDGSIVLRLSFGERRVLLPGDAERAEEEAMIARAGPDGLLADVVKLGHHGSRTSSSDALLAAVKPRHAIVSDGPDNHFGFPHQEVIARLGALGITVWRTDLQGMITIETDGTGLVISPFIKPKEAQ
jgi:competence protein ComEC